VDGGGTLAGQQLTSSGVWLSSCERTDTNSR
jgi:hypothetical protein